MKKLIKITRILLCITALSLCSCHSHIAVKDLEKSVGAAFNEKTGYDVSAISLIKTGENTYEGTIEYIAYGNILHKNIEVTCDLDDPTKFFWKYNGRLLE